GVAGGFQNELPVDQQRRWAELTGRHEVQRYLERREHVQFAVGGLLDRTEKVLVAAHMQWPTNIGPRPEQALHSDDCTLDIGRIALNLIAADVAAMREFDEARQRGAGQAVAYLALLVAWRPDHAGRQSRQVAADHGRLQGRAGDLHAGLE